MAHDVRNVMGGSTRGAVRTLSETYGLSLSEAARVYEGKSNASVHDRDVRVI